MKGIVMRTGIPGDPERRWCAGCEAGMYTNSAPDEVERYWHIFCPVRFAIHATARAITRPLVFGPEGERDWLLAGDHPRAARLLLEPWEYARRLPGIQRGKR